MPSIKLRTSKVGYYHSEVDYDRRLTAYNQMLYWWQRLLVQRGLQTGKITYN